MLTELTENNMALRNKSSKHDSNFDLDSYLEKKSSEETFQAPKAEPKEKKSSNFLRNLSLIVIAGLASVLWYYDWSPREAVAGIFGSTEPDLVVIETPGNESVILLPPTTPETPVVISNERIARLEESAVALANSEELERLTEESIALAMEAAFAALEGLEGLQGLEGLESLEALEGLEGLEGLEVLAGEAALEALSNIDFSEIDIVSGTSVSEVSSIEQYSQELSELNITQFDNESIELLQQAGIPISFLSQLNQAGLLERLDANEIVQLFEDN